ncbi:MAG: hypothetical protein II956_07440 [Bacteroidales bacterium]|nr:hypothetical protein [Bacteroidales bacterium]
MAKKTFKGGLDSLIENSLGIKKLKGKKTEFKGNPVDLDDKKEDQEPEKETEQKTPKEQEKKEEKTSDISAQTNSAPISLETIDDDTETTAYLKNLIQDMRHELYLWRNGKINVQTFNQTLHLHNLKYNPENNEIEEF